MEVSVTLQLSVAVGGVQFIACVHDPFGRVIVMLPGQFEITGLCISFILTLNVHETELPDASVATEVTVVFPIGKNEPEGGVLTTVTEQLSVAGTLKVTVLPHVPRGVDTVISEGQLITGS